MPVTITAVGAVIVALVTAAGQVISVRASRTDTVAGTASSNQSTMDDRPVLRVTAPRRGMGVGPSGGVSGTSRCRDMHYVSVTPLRTGDRWIVDGPIRVDAGQLDGRARYGDGDLGLGEEFAVEILCTPSQLAVGRLDTLPAASQVSASTVVVRHW